jgi:hypothetical protein
MIKMFPTLLFVQNYFRAVDEYLLAFGCHQPRVDVGHL